MSVDTQRTVAEFALDNAQAAAVFEKLGIDYCCNGRKPLAEVCQAAGIEVDRVTDLLTAASASNTGAKAAYWNHQSLAALTHHIVEKHHAFCRAECPRLGALLVKVRSKHGVRHPELGGIEEEFTALRNELEMHMMKEEQMLFPYIMAIERSASSRSLPPPAPFGTVQNPVRMMMLEHDSAGNAVREIRRLATNYTAPADACTSFKALYQGLEAFEADLHQHIHLENNLLFPRAIELEESVK